MRNSPAKRVLIAEDNDEIRKLVRSTLAREPSLEISAVSANGTEALERAIALKPDLVVLDLVLPGLSGGEIASVLRKKLPETKIVVFTMYGDTLGKIVAKSVGVDAVVAKSDGLTVLADTVRSLLQ
ncbi:MAG TPA: response regulator transcription factor [Candidatus Sulfotelmatobacter sp.]|nr:response regulator transcription factor [Candidatus Sulfotelmatobacter sp.]